MLSLFSLMRFKFVGFLYIISYSDICFSRFVSSIKQAWSASEFDEIFAPKSVSIALVRFWD